MNKCNDYRFDIQLEKGEIAEKQLCDILCNRKIEVKRDFYGNGRVVIEFESFGKPSGIVTTEADYWAFVLNNGIIHLVPTEKIKTILKEPWNLIDVVNGGEGGNSKMFRIPVTTLLL